MTRKHHKIEIATPEDVARYAQNPASQGDPPSSPEPQAGGPPPATGEAAQAAPPEQAPASEADALRSEIEQWKDKFLRAKAEMANYQRRTTQERADAVKFANAEFARSLLNVLDDIERALSHVGNADANGDAVVHAIKLIHDKFTKAMAEHHVEPIEAVGRPFDPNYHQALTEQPSDAYPEPTVLQEFQKGYRLYDRVLRPARVLVSKPPAAPGEDAGGSQTEPPPRDKGGNPRVAQ